MRYVTPRHLREGGVLATTGRLRFAEAAGKWLDGPVLELRPRTTQECYRNAVDHHLLPPFANRRLDSIAPDELTLRARELRGAGLSESTIVSWSA